MFAELLSSFLDKEQAIRDAISDTLVSLSEELGVDHSEFFLMIQPLNEKMEFKIYVYQKDPQTKIPKFIRELALKEILE